MRDKIREYLIRYFGKCFFILMLVISLAFGAVYYLNNFKNWNNNKGMILSYIENQLGGNVVLSGDLQFLFPVLNVPIISVTYENNEKQLVLQDVQIRFNVLSFLIFSPKVSAITVNSATAPFDIVLKNKEYIKDTGKAFLNILFNSLTLTSVPVLGNLHLYNTLLNWEGNQSFTKIALSMKMGRNDYSISANFDKGGSQILLKLNDYNMDFIFKNAVGKIRSTGKNVATVIVDLIIASLEEGRQKETDKIFSFVDDPFVLDIDFTHSGEELQFNKLLLQSDRISFHINEFKKSKKEFICDIMIEKFDLVPWSKMNVLSNHFSALLKYIDYDIADDFLGNIKLKANNIFLSKDSAIADFMLIAEIKNSIMDIQHFFVEMPKLLKLDMKGSTQHNGLHSNFVGEFKAVGEDFARFVSLMDINFNQNMKGDSFEIHSKFKVASDIFIISDFNLKTSNFNVISNMDYKINITDKKLRGFVEVHNLDFNHYDADFNIDTLTNFLKLKLEANISIRLFNSLVGDGNKIDEMLIYFNIADNILDFETIEVNAKNAKFSARLSLENINLKPNLTLYIDGNNLNVGILGLGKILKISHSEESGKVNFQWKKDPIRWFGLENVDAELVVKFKRVKFEDGDIYNLDFHAKVLKNLMTVEKLGFKIGKDTYANFIAYLGVEQAPSIKGSFVISNLNIKDFAESILKIEGVSGYSSLSGDLITKGESIHDMVKRLEGSIKITSTNALLKNVDFSAITKNLYSVRSRADLENLTRVKFFQGDTNLYSVNGAMNISGGISAMLLNFASDTANGIISSNFAFTNFMVNTITKMYFYVPQDENDPKPTKISSVDIYMQGDLWHPKVFFDNNGIYELLRHEIPELSKAS